MQNEINETCERPFFVGKWWVKNKSGLHLSMKPGLRNVYFMD
jgi:hypothetical protein